MVAGQRDLQLHDTVLAPLKVGSFMDPLRKEPRLQADVRALRFPD